MAPKTDAKRSGLAGRIDSSDPLNEIQQGWLERGYPGNIERLALANLIERVRRKIDNAIETSLKPLGLSRPRFELLLHLSSSPSGVYQLSHLSDLLVLHPASVTSLVDHLENLGYLRRVRGADRRVILAQITAKGRKVVVAGAEALADIDFGVPTASPREANALSRSLLKLL